MSTASQIRALNLVLTSINFLEIQISARNGYVLFDERISHPLLFPSYAQNTFYPRTSWGRKRRLSEFHQEETDENLNNIQIIAVENKIDPIESINMDHSYSFPSDIVVEKAKNLFADYKTIIWPNKGLSESVFLVHRIELAIVMDDDHEIVYKIEVNDTSSLSLSAARITTSPSLARKKKRRHHQVCAVANCPNPRDVSYHSFPKEPELQIMWVQSCGRDKVNPKTARICGSHFLKDDFLRDLKNELLGLPLVKRLKPGSVPTLNLGLHPQSSLAQLGKKKHGGIKVINANPHVLLKHLQSSSPNDSHHSFSNLHHDYTMSPVIFKNGSLDLTNEATSVINQVNQACTLQKLKSLQEKYTLEKKRHRAEIMTLKKELKHIKSKSYVDNLVYKTLLKTQTPAQASKILKPYTNVKGYTKKDITFSLALQSISNKAYKYIDSKILSHYPAIEPWRCGSKRHIALWDSKKMCFGAECIRFLTPFTNDRVLYAFADTLHMLRLLRNHVIDNGFQIPDGNTGFVPLIKLDFENILTHDAIALCDEKLHSKLTDLHLTCKGSGRKRIILAIQLFSESSAKGYCQDI
ncbi:unnamed protein product [Lepeophtheirus salmonis]|uniref:(salmon louse) hypothetical protein n=1 Tax=Lepeophtheirus salmonis TaxID=72036 RepID=A0A7R8CLX7_LEPSM|nr:unnamed protein product [Lepeophtheirus salmonis]CAF2861611.1 unnamed protein product [Lepeophtheirus salmonis]